MERLTYKDLTKACNDPWDYCGLDSVCKRDCFKPTPCHLPKQIHKLATYEDTGLEPLEIAAMQQELQAYKQAENDGKIIKLPCKVGDTVYMPWIYRGTSGIAKLEVISIDFYKIKQMVTTDFGSDCWEYSEKYNYGTFLLEDFGKTVFLTKEEAKKALEGMK